MNSCKRFCGILILMMYGNQLLHGQEINNDYVIAAILANDSRIRDLEISFERRIETPSDEPKIETGIWAHKGNLCYYRESRGTRNWENSWDGVEMRSLTTGRSPWPQGIIKRDEPPFMRNASNVLYIMGRTPLGDSLVDALEGGKARALAKFAKVDGRDCCVVEGNTITEDDRIFFRYWLDPECGFMPRRTEEYAYDGNVIVLNNICNEHKLSEVSPGIWLPVSYKAEGLKLKDGQWKQFAVNHWKVTKVAVNTGMSNERLKVKFPPGTYVEDYPHPNSNEYVEYVIAADGSADPDGLDALVKLTQASLGEGQAQRSRYASKDRAKWLVGCLVAGLGICGLVFARVRARSRSKEPRQHPGAR